MNSRERFECAMRHQNPDRVPIDIGGTSLTGMRPRCKVRLSQLLGFSENTAEDNTGIDEKILRWAGTDFRPVGAIVDLPSRHTRILSPRAAIDCWGVRREIVDGEWQITQSPLKGASLDDLKSFRWPEARVDEKQLEKWGNQAQKLREQNQYVVVAEHPVYGILELGCWMCGYGDFFLKLAADTDFVRFFFDKLLEIQLAVIEQYYSVLGSYADLTTSGDDFGSQNGPLISPAMFGELIVPYFSARIKRTKELAQCPYWHHTCGSVVKLLDQIIDCGVDILNPIQTSAADMEPKLLKDRFGDRIVFWGAVDVQQFLPRAAPEEVPEQIQDLIDVLGEKGGYVMAPAHEMQDDIPPENIAAWVDTVHNHTRQPS
ncbi:methylcobalamin:coenzyme M methyltransferase [bacterium BMS3Bbin03]|nr:methylcobalamin:coenzyme M methyltransferase [bacterium BMS3Bbin03]HDZ12775.1 methyltransferase [Bacteroidota bacterium]